MRRFILAAAFVSIGVSSFASRAFPQELLPFPMPFDTLRPAPAPGLSKVTKMRPILAILRA
jgi:hypothetical protein